MTGGSYYYYECRSCKVGSTAGVESKIEIPKKLEEPLLKKSRGLKYEPLLELLLDGAKILAANVHKT